LRAGVRSFWLPKAGNQPHEYEDAFWPARSMIRTARTIRCAVADGATEASFSGLWAGMLVQAFGRGRLASHRIRDTLVPLQAAWWNEVSRKPLPWYAEEKRRSGAFSSLLGLILTEARDGNAVTWSVTAVGDSCLFLVRDDALVVSFPLQASDHFDNRPSLISSVLSRNDSLENVLCHESGLARPGDTFYLLTDALACWFLARCEEGNAPWTTLDGIGEATPRESFADWMTGERRDNRIRNDDVTMLRMRLE
jgi:hypothetical protein